jgi:hypothetical protein
VSSVSAPSPATLTTLPLPFRPTGLTLWQHPSFFAYFPTASTFEGILGDLYANSVPNPGFNVRILAFRRILD